MRKAWLGWVIAGTVIGALVVSAANEPEQTASGSEKHLAVATFAGGCFWCIESGFEQVPGVGAAISGYTGGQVENPTYKQVSKGSTGHLESVRVYYDPEALSYEGLLAAFWRMVNPTDGGGQFADRGEQYSTAIFYHDERQKAVAERSRQALAASGRYTDSIVTPIRPAGEFFEAEEYHQDYYRKNPVRYKLYRYGSGRDQYLEKTWGKDLHVDYSQFAQSEPAKYGKPSDEELRKRLDPLQYRVTQKEGTEPAFDNTYWDEKRDGIYVDIVSGEPLFSSKDKFDSGTGWPSFIRPLEKELIVEKTDFKLIYPRTELRSRYGDSHLGHVFKDGPAPTGLRYCINSASLRFIPKEELTAEGYAQYEALFE